MARQATSRTCTACELSTPLHSKQRPPSAYSLQQSQRAALPNKKNTKNKNGKTSPSPALLTTPPKAEPACLEVFGRGPPAPTKYQEKYPPKSPFVAWPLVLGRR
mmetsp:Transcript_62592/g.136848  ORF Transcript_62592/g.136848 Transcript_62592/m.136848 type:complete len:104 (+) Transcript_62592:444-755(+)